MKRPILILLKIKKVVSLKSNAVVGHKFSKLEYYKIFYRREFSIFKLNTLNKIALFN